MLAVSNNFLIIHHLHNTLLHIITLFPCSDPYCTLEVDSYGHFQTKAKTRLCENTQNPEWNSEFELEVEGTQTLRILCYDRARGSSASYDDDVLIAKGKVGVCDYKCSPCINYILVYYKYRSCNAITNLKQVSVI